MKSLLLKAIGTLGFAVLTLNAYADQGSGHQGMNMGGMDMDCSKQMQNMKGKEGMKMDCMGGKGASQAMGVNEAEVKAVDKANKKITLRHGPIKSNSVDMPPMTMAFPVRQPSLLSNVKVGDKVRFTMENVKNMATVTDLQVEK
jgi:Cu(I)/Ag(I) efflux system protein CusF